jgi:dTDP-4-amino-4,6-dideoxygalactose transaminase
MNLFQTKISKEDTVFISEVLQSGNLGYGPMVDKFQYLFQTFSNKKFNIATNSASASAFMVFAYLKEKYGVCDVYTTSLGFISPAWAAKHFGHNLIWVDIDENLLFSVDDYREKRRVRTERYTDGGITPVLMPVLYGGVSTIPKFDTLKKDNYNEIVVVDSAHCVTPTIESDFIFFSFHPFKPVAASDGGMISTNDTESVNFFNLYRNFGRQNSGSTYDVVSNGFKFYMNNLNAAIAITQLARYDENLNTRKKSHILVESLNLNGRLLPHDESSSYYFATLICEESYVNDLYKKYPTSKHYPLIHKTSLMYSDEVLPKTEKLHKLILNLPLYDENIYHS